MTRRSNCLLWAVLLYLRRRAKGRQGYIMLRRSRWGGVSACPLRRGPPLACAALAAGLGEWSTTTAKK